MMSGLPESHPSISFYDGDYPGTETCQIPDNLDDALAYQGLAHDVARFRELALETRGDILEVGCGTGRVLIPLARAGSTVLGIDISAPMLEKARARLAEEPEEVRERVQLELQSICEPDLRNRRFGLIIVPFNGLSCIADFESQIQAIARSAAHLEEGGRLVLDLVNPLALPLLGNTKPQLFLSRVSPETGRKYMRFAGHDRLQPDQRQRLYGWYDERTDDGTVRRTPYEMNWRLIFRYEAELMVRASGLEVVTVEGGHRREPFQVDSPKIFLIAQKKA